MAEFVHLHVHSDYSFLDGACRISLDKEVASQITPAPPLTLPKYAAKQGFKAVALTDHGVLFGAIDFYKSCRAEKLKPILGCELYVSSQAPGSKRKSHEAVVDHHLIVLAKDVEGYHNLIRIVSAGHLQNESGDVPRVDKAVLAAFSKGLVVTSACIRGEIGTRVLAGDTKGALKAIGEYQELFGKDDFYLELNDQGLSQQKDLNRFLIGAAKKTGAKLVAANDVHYLRREDAEMQDVLMCLKNGTLQADERRTGMGSDQFYLKSADEMAALFAETPEALAATLEIAEKCNVEVELGKNRYPEFTPPDEITPSNYIQHLCRSGLDHRYPGVPEEERTKLDSRLEFELSVLESQGFTSYLLIVWDFIHYAKSNGIAVGPGRGSAAGSLAAYALGITDVDPMRYNLLFERFQNPERKSPPDIDVDFDPTGRERVINYVRDKYGEDCVTQIVTYGTMGAKNSIRDVARVLGYSFTEGDRISKLIPTAVGVTISNALGGVVYKDEKATAEAKKFHAPDFEKAYQNEDDVRRVVDLARQMEGMCRQAGIHAAGVVICGSPVGEIAPLARGAKGEVITQYDMNTVAELGLLKMDFLGLKTLTVIEDAFRLIEVSTGKRLTRDDIPLDDPKAIKLFQEAKTVGLFQFESAGMRRLLRDFVPESVEHLIALNALYRPGPLDLAPDFCARRHKKKEVTYEHPLLEQVCSDTFGIMIYQEQVMSAASVLGGYTLGEADLLRRAMGKKDKAQMAKEREKFVAGCAKTNKIPQAKADQIFDLLEKFAGYGFNKSHSAAYGVLAMQTGWLKANYPAEYMAGLMCNDIGKTDALSKFGAECRAMGVVLLPPDVNQSDVKFTVENNAVRYGLAGVKGVGEAAVELLVIERKKHGPFKDLDDLCHRCDPASLGRRTLENLAKVGAFDALDANRKRVFEAVGPAMEAASEHHRDMKKGQGSLFGDVKVLREPVGKSKRAQKEEPDWTMSERINHERDLLGVYLSAHPLDTHQDVLSQIQTTPLSEAETMEGRQVVRLAALITGLELRFTKDQRAFAKAVLEDQTGAMPLFVSPADFEKFGAVLKDRQVALVSGYVEDDRRGAQGAEGAEERQSSFRALEIVPIEQAAGRFAEFVTVELAPGGASVDVLDQLLRNHGGGCPIRFHVPWKDSVVEIEPNAHFFVRPGAEFLQKLGEVPGVARVSVKVTRQPPLPEREERKERGGRGGNHGG